LELENKKCIEQGVKMKVFIVSGASPQFIKLSNPNEFHSKEELKEKKE